MNRQGENAGRAIQSLRTVSLWIFAWPMAHTLYLAIARCVFRPTTFDEAPRSCYWPEINVSGEPRSVITEREQIPTLLLI
jgi:hypothetical protein